MKLFFSILVLFFIGCSNKQVLTSESYTILFKSKKFKFYDSGFINQHNNSLKVQIFGVGTPVLDMDIYDKSICLNGNCFEKEVFNNNYLNNSYPKETMQNIILAKPIFNSQNLEKNGKNFTQKIYQKEKFDITYKVNSNEIYFKDSLNNILIKIRKL